MFIVKVFAGEFRIQCFGELRALREDIRRMKDEIRNINESIESIVNEIGNVKTTITGVTQTLKAEIDMARCMCEDKRPKSTSTAILVCTCYKTVFSSCNLLRK